MFSSLVHLNVVLYIIHWAIQESCSSLRPVFLSYITERSEALHRADVANLCCTKRMVIFTWTSTRAAGMIASFEVR